MSTQPYYVFQAGEGRRYEARGSVMHFKATSDIAGRFSLMERTLPPGGRMPPPHVHVANDEAFFVLDGAITFVLDGSHLTYGPETFVLVPGGTGHTFGNLSTAPARLLVLHAPPLDAYFAELQALWSRLEPPSLEEEQALMRRHGMAPA